MRSGIQGLGWFLRRGNDPIAAGAFYENCLGLPRLRSWELPDSSGVMLWAGNVGVLELNQIHEQSAMDPHRSQCTPVFGTSNLFAAEQELGSKGLESIGSEEDERANTHIYVDPDGLPFGVEEVKAPALLETDKRWQQMRGTGLSRLPGGIKMNGSLDGISRVIHRVPSVGPEREFLVRIGLADVGQSEGAVLLSMGDSCLLELRADGPEISPIAERSLAVDTWILRVYGLDIFRSRLADSTSSFLSQHEFAGGTLDYALTPCQRLFGWQERRRYDPDIAMTQLIEDLDARDRWIHQR